MTPCDAQACKFSKHNASVIKYGFNFYHKQHAGSRVHTRTCANRDTSDGFLTLDMQFTYKTIIFFKFQTVSSKLVLCIHTSMHACIDVIVLHVIYHIQGLTHTPCYTMEIFANIIKHQKECPIYVYINVCDCVYIYIQEHTLETLYNGITNISSFTTQFLSEDLIFFEVTYLKHWHD